MQERKKKTNPDSLDGKKDNRGKCTAHYLNSNMQNKQQLSKLFCRQKE